METCEQRSIKLQQWGSRSNETDVPEMSVLLPTYRRPDALLRTLQSLEKQTVDESAFEIVVIDDGSGDCTEKVLGEFAEKTKSCFSFAVLEKNGGPARARNAGLGMCRGSIILIIGDDIEPDCSLLERHLSFHRQNRDETSALLGHVSFPEALKPNAFMRWLEKGGRKYFFNYQGLMPMQEVEPIFFYTCNVSVKLSLLEKSGWFDESFPYASHEDIELGYRLAEHGMQLIYDPDAKGYHWHMLSVKGIAKRVYLMGYSAVIFWKKVKNDGSRLRVVARKLLAHFSATPLFVWVWKWLHRKHYKDDKNYPIYWQILLFLSFFIGLSDAANKRSLRL